MQSVSSLDEGGPLPSPTPGVLFDDFVTPNVIFGPEGVANGNFTVRRVVGVELGLRARLRYTVCYTVLNCSFVKHTCAKCFGSFQSFSSRSTWNCSAIRNACVLPSPVFLSHVTLCCFCEKHQCILYVPVPRAVYKLYCRFTLKMFLACFTSIAPKIDYFWIDFQCHF